MNNPATEAWPGDQPSRAYGPNQERPDAKVDYRDAAFASFVRLDGVDPNADLDQLREAFTDCYVGTWTDEAQMIRDLSSIGLVEAAITELAQEGLPVERVASIDYAALDELIRERWNLVPDDQSIHVFEK